MCVVNEDCKQLDIFNAMIKNLLRKMSTTDRNKKEPTKVQSFCLEPHRLIKLIFSLSCHYYTHFIRETIEVKQKEENLIGQIILQKVVDATKTMITALQVHRILRNIPMQNLKLLQKQRQVVICGQMTV